jgi:hypothetical protein
MSISSSHPVVSFSFLISCRYFSPLCYYSVFVMLPSCFMFSAFLMTLFRIFLFLSLFFLPALYRYFSDFSSTRHPGCGRQQYKRFACSRSTSRSARRHFVPEFFVLLFALSVIAPSLSVHYCACPLLRIILLCHGSLPRPANIPPPPRCVILFGKIHIAVPLRASLPVRISNTATLFYVCRYV